MSDVMELTRQEIFSTAVRLILFAGLSYFTMQKVVSILDPTSQQKKQAALKARELLQRLGVAPDKDLTEYEHIIASQLVLGESLGTRWRDVAGLQSVIRELRETVILPIQQSRHHTSSLIKPPKGVLLHGPPGCGKTLLARAVAREAGCRFINLDVSALTDKWYGESQKLASAVFSLATKIQPCIIFIDEVDSFLRVRAAGDHEATAMMKAQFLQHWDGLGTDQSAHVIVMAATNRPHDVDRAILRRLPAAFHIKLPGVEERESILRLVMRSESMEEAVDLKALAGRTDNFSGSDLRELCRNAAVYRLRSLLTFSDSDDDTFHSAEETVPAAAAQELRAITMEDFNKALFKMRGSRVLDLSAATLASIETD